MSKASIVIINNVYDICKNKIDDNNSTKGPRGEFGYVLVRTLHWI